ncbi:MAG: hypothetical protein ABR957_08900 [Terracidiphilus sp.]|jgi:hypothetical protein
MKPKCRHIMPSGKQCHAYSLRDEPFCFFHSRLRRAAKQPVSKIDSFDIPLLEDRCAVQLTITRVLRALVNKTIDRQNASTLLYDLQLALQSVDQSDWAIGFSTVEGVSETPDGDVIAPDPYEDCEDDEDEIEEDEEEEVDHDGDEDEDEEEEEEGEEENDENESTEQLIATLNQLESVNRALEAGDMRPVARLLGVGG